MKCDVCDRKFRTAHGVRIHKAIAHKATPEEQETIVKHTGLCETLRATIREMIEETRHDLMTELEDFVTDTIDEVLGEVRLTRD